MAQGDLKVFYQFPEDLLELGYDIDGDVIKLMLITEAYSAVDATAANPQKTTFTEVTGTGYTAGGATLTVTASRASNVTTIAITGSPAASWTQNGAGPTNIKTGIIYNDTDANDRAIAAIDFTTDGGTTAISLQAGDITWTASSGIATFTV